MSKSNVRSLNDQDLSEFKEDGKSAPSAFVSVGNQITYDEALAIVKEKIAYLAPNKSIVYVKKPETKSRLQISEGAAADREKHILIYCSIDDGAHVGKEAVVLGNINIGLFGKGDIGVVENHTILLIEN